MAMREEENAGKVIDELKAVKADLKQRKVDLDKRAKENKAEHVEIMEAVKGAKEAKKK